MTRLRLFTLLAAVAVFCVVQDRVTAAGARRYIELYRSASPADGERVTIDSVMRPAIRDSLRQALLWSGGVAAAGIAVSAVSRRRSRRE